MVERLWLNADILMMREFYTYMYCVYIYIRVCVYVQLQGLDKGHGEGREMVYIVAPSKSR